MHKMQSKVTDVIRDNDAFFEKLTQKYAALKYRKKISKKEFIFNDLYFTAGLSAIQAVRELNKRTKII